MGLSKFFPGTHLLPNIGEKNEPAGSLPSGIRTLASDFVATHANKCAAERFFSTYLGFRQGRSGSILPFDISLTIFFLCMFNASHVVGPFSSETSYAKQFCPSRVSGVPPFGTE